MIREFTSTNSYLLGYVWGYGGLNVLKDARIFKEEAEMGWGDGSGDFAAGVLPMVNTNCTPFLQEPDGLLISSFYSPMNVAVTDCTALYAIGVHEGADYYYIKSPLVATTWWTIPKEKIDQYVK